MCEEHRLPLWLYLVAALFICTLHSPLPVQAAALDLPRANGIPASLLGRYSYTEPDCSGSLELLPAVRGYRAVISTTCAGGRLCSETFSLQTAATLDDGTIRIQDASGLLTLELKDGTMRVPAAADYLCLYDDGQMSGLYTKYTPSSAIVSERMENLQKELAQMRELAGEAQGPNLRERSEGQAFPLGTQDADLSGSLMEAYRNNPATGVPSSGERVELIAALIAYHEKVLGSIGFSLEATVLDAFATCDFSYWGRLKTSRRADVATPYLAILDSPEVTKTLLENGVISRQLLLALIEFAPWYKAAFP